MYSVLVKNVAFVLVEIFHVVFFISHVTNSHQGWRKETI